MANHRKPIFDQAKEMYEKGLSIQEVANFYSITRQAMWSALKRRGTKMRPQLRYAKNNHFYRGTKASGRAHDILEKAMKKGLIKRPLCCETCSATGMEKKGRSVVQAHHYDYNKPLDVMWLCQQCHHEWHKHNKAIPLRKTIPPMKRGGIEKMMLEK